MIFMADSIFVCPVCSEALIKTPKEYYCRNSHHFDRAKEGYVNLLLGQSGGVHGDDKIMVASRKRFLDLGHYSPLREGIISEIGRVGAQVVLDAGCGEGYYTSGIAERTNASVFGVDMSKEALKCCSKRSTDIDLAVASVYHLPVKDESADALLSAFSPFARDEFLRVLRRGGRLIMAIPAARHLFSLKALLYDTPYENEVAPFELDGFELEAHTPLRYSFTLTSREEILDLFSMTPYRYRTKGALDRISRVEKLDIEAEFELLTYTKK